MSFLISSTLSYLSLRSYNPLIGHKLERYADVLFLVGLAIMVVLAYEAGTTDSGLMVS